MDGFAVNADDLGRQAPAFEAVAGMVASLHQAIASTAAAYNGSWGNDLAGETFASQYLPVEQKALEQLGTAVQAVQTMADAVLQWAQSYPATDSGLI